jgi:hypothetical protein
MKPLLSAARSLAALSILAAAGQAAMPPRTEDWFRWGDYDSLIAVLGPWSQDTGQAPPERARAFLYLGVAYQAGNERRLSDSAFYKACDLDSAAALDQYYVAPEILDHFRAVAADCRSRRSAPAPSPAPADTGRKQAPAAPRAGKAAAPEPAARAGSNAILWWSVGGAMAAAALAGGALLLLQPERKPIDSVTVIDGR